MNTLDELGCLLVKRFGLGPQEVAPERTLRSLGIDSLAALELLFEIEAVFGITLPDAAEQAVTIGDIVGLVDHELQPLCADRGEGAEFHLRSAVSMVPSA